MLPASTGERKRRDVSQGPPRRPHGRDPAPDRPLAARRGRLRGARRAHRLDRLRRARGRRRHPLRRDHRRLCGARAGAAPRWSPRASSTRCRSRSRSPRSRAGMVDGRALLDLDYSEDSTAEVDANVVMTGDGGLVEVQATAERTPLSRASLDELLALAAPGIEQLRAAQQEAVRRPRPGEPCGSSSPPATSTSCASCSELMRPHELDPLPDEIELPPETGTTFAENALGKARAAAAATGAPGDRRRLGHRGGRARRRARGVVGPLRRRGRHRRGEPRQAAGRGARPTATRRVAYVCALAYVEPGGARAGRARPLRGPLAHEPRGSGGFGYDPAFVPGRLPRRRAHDGRARRREEKDAISHRGRAARALALRLREAEEASAGRPLRSLFGGPVRAGAASERRPRAHARRSARRWRASPRRSCWSRSSSSPAWSPGRSRSSPRRSTRAPTSSPRCSPCSRCGSRSARPTASTTTATARPSTWPRSARARS